MVRVLSDEVRARILNAAERLFADAGYTGATMASVAARAGVATGNIYRYFADKDALFYSVCSDEFAATFLRLVQKRVESLVTAKDLARLPESAQNDAEALLSFWVEHRLKVITILDRAQGSKFETFADELVGELMRPSLRKLRAESGRSRLDASTRFLLTQIFRNTVRMIVAILENHEDEASVRHAFTGFWNYQLAGLAGFAEWVKS